MKWKDFKRTDLFKSSDIVVVLRAGTEIQPRPMDHVITAYPIKCQEYPHIPAICVEIL